MKNTTKVGIPNRSFRNIFPNLCFYPIGKLSYHKKSIVKSIEKWHTIRGNMNTQDSQWFEWNILYRKRNSTESNAWVNWSAIINYLIKFYMISVKMINDILCFTYPIVRVRSVCCILIGSHWSIILAFPREDCY